MSNLLIRDVEDRLVQLLKSKAAVNGTSLQQEASKALRRGAPMSADERRALFDSVEQSNGFPKVISSGADMMRAVRDGDKDSL